MSGDTFSLYRAMAEERPVRARRYETSIRASLVAGVAPLEAERLREALEGIAVGLAVHGPVCERCGRAAEHLTNGRGSTCARKAS